jgi:hypothetical protein
MVSGFAEDVGDVFGADGGNDGVNEAAVFAGTGARDEAASFQPIE